MNAGSTVKQALKRGALVTAANWEIVIVQFVADALFKTLLVVPLIGGVFLVVLLLGGVPSELFALDWRDLLPTIASVLVERPGAFAAFMAALVLILVGGALLMFLVKGGSMTVLLAGERAAGAIERPPLRLLAIRRASAFSLERFTAGARGLFRRYLRLGLSLYLVYAISAALYLTVVFVPRTSGDEGGTLTAALASLALVLWITVVNFLYLQFQIVVASEDCEVLPAIRHVFGWLRLDPRPLLLVFVAILVLFTLTTAASILATTALGLIAFVPLVGLAALPLQLVAWLLRGMVFQYIGLSGLVAYARLHRRVHERVAHVSHATILPQIDRTA